MKRESTLKDSRRRRKAKMVDGKWGISYRRDEEESCERKLPDAKPTDPPGWKGDASSSVGRKRRRLPSNGAASKLDD